LPETGLLPTGSSWPGVGDKAGSLTGGAFRFHSDRVAPHLTYPELATIITLDRAGFNRIFGSTALAWRGKTVLQRNAAIALGNQGDPAALVPLQQALHAPAAILRAHAAWALGRLGATGHPALAAALATEADPLVRREIKEALEGRCSR
jgi:epoxyqueuosine reductase